MFIFSAIQRVDVYLERVAGLMCKIDFVIRLACSTIECVVDKQSSAVDSVLASAVQRIVTRSFRKSEWMNCSVRIGSHP